MVRTIVLQADRFQAELIVSDIPHHGKAYLRGLVRSGADAAAAGRQEPTADPERELADLIEMARRLTGSLGGKTLLAGFRPDGPVPQLTPENPPAGMHPFTSFVRLTADTRTIAAQEQPGLSAANASWRRVRLTPERIGEFMSVHRDGMADVPNVPVLTEADVREMMVAGQVDLLVLADGTANGTVIGFASVVTDAAAGTAELDEIAILPAWRSRGIGRIVIAELARELADTGIGTLSVLVATINTGAMRLYEALGFGSPQLFAHWFQLTVSRREAVAPMHTAAELAADLSRLGVRPGETLMVHSSLSSIGWVPGAAEALIDALTEALGPQGTLVMPAHSGENSDPANWEAPPVPSAWWPAIRSAIPAFRAEITPTNRVGHVADVFRTLPGTRRSSHPSCSLAARGLRADELLSGHPLSEPLGPASPLGKLVANDARVLQIGTGFDTCTVMHLGEHLADCRLRIRQGAAMLVDGQRQWIEYDDLHVNSDEFVEPGRLLESRGLVQTGKVGEARCRLFRAADAVAAAGDWLRQNRMHRLGEADRGWLMALLQREPEYNLFLIGDIENDGFDKPFQDIMAFCRPAWLTPAAAPAPAAALTSAGAPAPAAALTPAAAFVDTPPAVDSILLRYYTNFIVYSEYDDFALEPVLSALDYPPLTMLSAKKPIMDRLRPYLPGFRFSDTFMMKRPIVADEAAGAASFAAPVAAPPPEEPRVTPPHSGEPELATLADVPDLAAFLFGIAEFAVANQSLVEKTAVMQRSLSGVGTRYVVIREQGRIVACAGSTAENRQSAMVVSVATDPAYRRRGYATRLVRRLCALHAQEGREFLCLFYSNPAAGVIYRGLGFGEIGTWVMARPPVRAPGEGV